jgi:hypothetical protein
MATTRRKPRRIRRTAQTLAAARSPAALRWSKVISAQTRIASGHYDRDEVRTALVEAVLRELRKG